MRRCRDWRARLHAWSQTVKGQPFAWGKTDCATLVRQALFEMFGAEVVPQLPRWDSATAALRVLREYGPPGKILLDAGAELTTLPFMRAGDIVVADSPEEDSGGVGLFVVLDGTAVLGSWRTGVWVATVPDLQGSVYSLWVTHGG